MSSDLEKEILSAIKSGAEITFRHHNGFIRVQSMRAKDAQHGMYISERRVSESELQAAKFSALSYAVRAADAELLEALHNSSKETK